MSTCQDCEVGRCPCGTGCTSCVHTGTCSTCNGTTMQEAPRPQDLRFTRHRRPAPVVLRGARPTCGTCGRRSHGQPRSPDFEHMRVTSPGNYKREMEAIRCPGCHRRFLNGVPTTPTYRLMEATS